MVRGVSQRGIWVVGKEVGNFVVIKDVSVVGGVENVLGGVGCRWRVVSIVLGVVDGLVWTALNDKTGVLKKWLFLVQGQGFNASNGSVGHAEFRPLVARKPVAGAKGEGKIVALCVVGGSERDGTKGTRPEGVGWCVVLKDMNVGPELDAHPLLCSRGHRFQ